MHLKVVSAEFETSAVEPAGWPEAGPEEIAFIGRSNVGKSSLLNALSARRGLARTSNAPGRTRLVNFFQLEIDVDGSRRPLRFVDLPGFGYAKVSKSERAQWMPIIEKYLARRSPLKVAALLVDARRVPESPPRKSDAPAKPGKRGDADGDGELLDERELGMWLAQRKVTVVPVITKTDKLSKHERPLIAERLKRILPAGFGAPVLVSAETGDGCEQLWRRLLAAL